MYISLCHHIARSLDKASCTQQSKSKLSLLSIAFAFRASSQSLIGRVARYTHSSDFEMQLLNNTQYDCN